MKHAAAFLFLMLAMSFASRATAADAKGAKASVGKEVPDFTLTDITGKTHKLSEYRGKVVVLEWTNPNCPFVVRVYKDGIIPQMQKEAASKGIVWLTINSTSKSHKDFEPNESLRETYAGWNASHSALLVDAEGTVGRMFDARTTPHMFVINEQGTLVYDGALDDDPRGSKSQRINYVINCLNELEGGEEVRTATTKPYGCSVKY